MKKRLSVLLLIAGMSLPVFAQVDYATEIQPIFEANCTSCHGGSGGVDLSSYASLMNSVGNDYGSNVVVPGDPDASGLVDKIEPNPDHGSRMPQGGTLSDADIALIRQWISEGASEVATSNEVVVETPTDFRLLGNYPNPFNPSTQIRFEVPQASSYTISIYSIHGMLIKEQVGSASAGEVGVSVDLGINPTGVYLYQVAAFSNGQKHLIGTGQMTLIK